MDLFQIDSLILDGTPINIADDTTTFENPLGAEYEGHASASGEHGRTRKAVVPMIKSEILFGGEYTPADFDVNNVDIVLKQINTGKRVRCPKASISKLGEMGKGKVSVEFMVMGEPQWL